MSVHYYRCDRCEMVVTRQIESAIPAPHIIEENHDCPYGLRLMVRFKQDDGKRALTTKPMDQSIEEVV